MIELCRLNNTSITVNAAHIVSVEATPDTLLTLLNGDKLLVREGIDEVVQRATQYLKLLGRGPLVVAARPEQKDPSWT